jgi:excisionase family DNA binding protein
MRAIKLRGVPARQDIAPHNALEDEGNTILQQYPPLLTVEETASILRLSPGRCRLACREGRIPAIHIGAQWRIPRTRLEVMLMGDEQ